jgi:hypothetical protein
MRTYEELKKILDGKPIDQIEKGARENQGKAKDFYIQFLEHLFYLEKSGRFADNPKYKKSRFEDYIQFEFGLNHKTYQDHRLAYRLYPEITSRHSPNLFAKTKKLCGAKKVGTVFKEIKTKEKSLSRPIRKEEIQQIIVKHAKPVKPKAPKPDVVKIQDENDKVKCELQSVTKVLDAKDEQIIKLKATVRRLRQELETVRKERDELLAIMAPVANVFKDQMDRAAVAVQ